MLSCKNSNSHCPIKLRVLRLMLHISLVSVCHPSVPTYMRQCKQGATKESSRVALGQRNWQLTSAAGKQNISEKVARRHVHGIQCHLVVSNWKHLQLAKIKTCQRVNKKTKTDMHMEFKATWRFKAHVNCTNQTQCQTSGIAHFPDHVGSV